MKTIFSKLLLFSLLLLVSCAPKGIPKYIQQAQEEYEQQPRRQVEDPNEVRLAPIEQILDTTKRAGFLGLFAQQSANWGYEFCEIDQHELFIEDNALRMTTVFVFDTGADKDHENIKDIIAEGRNFIPVGSSNGKSVFDGNLEESFIQSDAWNDGHGHGTHVTSTIAGAPLNGAPIGVAYPLVKAGKIRIVVVKVLSDQGRGSFTQIANGIRWANERAQYYQDRGDFVIYNFSLGGSYNNTAVDELLRSAKQSGVLITMCANGNTGRESNNFPASSDHTEGIVALNSAGDRAGFSTIGNFSSFSFPGQSIYAAYKNGTYGRLSGTSMASPHAAGLAAIYASLNPSATADQIIKHFQNKAIDLEDKGWDKLTGYGAIKLGSLLESGPPPPDEPGEQPERPDEPPVDEPDEPTTPPDEPTQPERTDEYTINKTYSMLWSTMDDQSNRQRVYFTVKVKYKHRSDVNRGAEKSVQICDDFFRSRGLVLPAGSDATDAAYWSAYFFRLILRKEHDIRISDMVISFDGATMRAPRIPELSAINKHKRKAVITYQW